MEYKIIYLKGGMIKSDTFSNVRLITEGGFLIVQKYMSYNVAYYPAHSVIKAELISEE